MSGIASAPPNGRRLTVVERHLLSAAVEVRASSQPYTLRAVCAAADVSPPLLGYYFATRQRFHREVFWFAARRLQRLIVNHSRRLSLCSDRLALSALSAIVTADPSTRALRRLAATRYLGDDPSACLRGVVTMLEVAWLASAKATSAHDFDAPAVRDALGQALLVDAVPSRSAREDLPPAEPLPCAAGVVGSEAPRRCHRTLRGRETRTK